MLKRNIILTFFSVVIAIHKCNSLLRALTRVWCVCVANGNGIPTEKHQLNAWWFALQLNYLCARRAEKNCVVSAKAQQKIKLIFAGNLNGKWLKGRERVNEKQKKNENMLMLLGWLGWLSDIISALSLATHSPSSPSTRFCWVIQHVNMCFVSNNVGTQRKLMHAIFARTHRVRSHETFYIWIRLHSTATTAYSV